MGKRRRKALDLTQQELAQRVGCSLATIIKIEADERRPSRQMAELLAQVLDLPPDQHDLFLKIARQEKGNLHLDALPHLPSLISLPPEQPKINLPTPLTPLVGREYEAAMIVQQLLNPTCRLLTLTGSGGVGKSRLALEAAHKSQYAYPHGVFFVPLAGTASPEFILPAVAEAVGFTFTGAENPQAQLFHFLGGKCLLLVLDNLEQLLNGIEILSDLLQQCPDVKILATSREPLNLRIEWAVAVQGLPIPSGLRLESIESNSAAALVVQRARQGKIDFVLSEEDLPDVERICRAINDRHHSGALERILEAGYREFTKLRGQKGLDPATVIDGSRRAMRATYQREIDDLEAHLAFLAYVGSVSPYVGLFGTVWGIMHSFRGLASMSTATLAAVAPGIAEALVATAIG